MDDVQWAVLEGGRPGGDGSGMVDLARRGAFTLGSALWC